MQSDGRVTVTVAQARQADMPVYGPKVPAAQGLHVVAIAFGLNWPRGHR